ncbi:MAG TPA: hypothetical protein VFI15_05985 [Candidatus Limnocylindrales bacterium]|nr:hypothetical protein [Candidatus Limnocylindrales bacterium]
MASDRFTTRELVFAVGATALTGLAALALARGGYQAAILVEIAMVAGFASVLRGRDAVAKGRPFLRWSQWSAVGWFGLAALGLLFARNLA